MSTFVCCLSTRCVNRPEIRYRLPFGDVLIGRGREVLLRLDHDAVSRQHCRLHIGQERVTVEDLGSTNGAFLNGIRLKPREATHLMPGDEIRIGPVYIRLETVTQDRKLRVLPASFIIEQGLGLSIGKEAQGALTMLVDGPTVVGSDAACGIRVSQTGVEPHHAYLRPRDQSLHIKAIGEAEIWHNNRRVRSVVLHKGKQVRLGKQVALRVDSCYILREIPPEPTKIDLKLVGKNEVLIGRSLDCDVRLDHPTVSRHHTRLRRRRSGWIVEDLSSLHGTFVDGVRLTRPVMIQEGQLLEIVGHRFIVAGSILTQIVPSGVQRIDAIRLGRRVQDGKIILRDVSLHMETGELIALAGSTGSGKTTLLNALSGFAPASHGKVLFNGRNLYRRYDLFRSQIGYVPQQDILHESLPLDRALLYSAELRLPDHRGASSHLQRIRSVMVQLGLSGVQRHTIAILSGGEHKRANIAAELIAAPSVLFLDEPAAGLDPDVEQALMRQLRTLADSGKVVVVVTHVTQSIMFCDKVAFVAPGGYLAYFGPPEEALRYFRVKTFPEIYKKLMSEKPSVQWAKQYRASRAYALYVREPRAQMARLGTPVGMQHQQTTKRTPRSRQFIVLVRRYIDLIARDRRNLLMLFLQAPAIALLMKMGFKRTAFDTQPAPEGFFYPPHGDGQAAIMILFFLALVAVWLGIFDATREIVKEQAIYLRERMATIDVWPYLLSKVIVLGMIGVIQIFSFLLVASLVIELPVDNLGTYLGLFGTLMMGNLLGIGMGLLVSAVVTKADKANTAMLFLIVPQMLLAGAFITVSQMDAVSKLLSLFAAARWTFETLGTQVDILDILQKQQGASVFIRDTFVETFSINVTGHLAVMAAGFVLLLIGCYIALRRKDPL